MKTSTTALAEAGKPVACASGGALAALTHREVTSSDTWGFAAGPGSFWRGQQCCTAGGCPGFHAALPCSAAPEAAGSRRSLRAQLCCFRGGHAWRGPVREMPAARLQHWDGLKPPPAASIPCRACFYKQVPKSTQGSCSAQPCPPVALALALPLLPPCSPGSTAALAQPTPRHPVIPSKWASLLGAKASSSQIPQSLCKTTLQNRGLL